MITKQANPRFTDFDHTPLLQVRDLPGEQVFAEAWRKLLSTPTDGYVAPILGQILECFSSRYSIAPRDAQVLASVITWLGTRCGKVFLDAANRASESNDRYLREWSSKNRLVPWVNQGRRTLENILFGPNSDRRASLRELDAVENLMSWLGSSPDAAMLLENCEREIERRDRETSLVHYLSANCGLQDNQVQRVLELARTLTP